MKMNFITVFWKALAIGY